MTAQRLSGSHVIASSSNPGFLTGHCTFSICTYPRRCQTLCRHKILLWVSSPPGMAAASAGEVHRYRKILTGFAFLLVLLVALGLYLQLIEPAWWYRRTRQD